MRSAGGNRSRTAFEAEDKFRAREYGLNSRPHPRIEIAAITSPLVETQQPLDIVICHRPAISLARKGSNNLSRARQFVIPGRTADENASPARRFRYTGRSCRPGDRK